MCCHACPGYDVCKARGSLKQDDCCPKCPYFASCMEETPEEEDKVVRRQPARRA